MPAGHLVADRDDALGGDVHLHHLLYARRLKRCVSMTIPSTPEGTSSESFLTSSPARPKMACKSFSSGVSSERDFGDTLPTRMSPGTTKVPTRTTPCSSRLFSALGLTL